MNKIMLHIFLISIVNILFCQYTPIEKLTKTAYYYYDEGDYSNAIISFEDLLAKQELIYDQNDMHIAKTLTRLGELYSFMDMPDISTYYFQEAIIILEKSYEKRRNQLESPLMDLLTIYSFNEDSMMKKNIEKQLHSISSLFTKLDKALQNLQD